MESISLSHAFRVRWILYAESHFAFAHLTEAKNDETNKRTNTKKNAHEQWLYRSFPNEPWVVNYSNKSVNFSIRKYIKSIANDHKCREKMAPWFYLTEFNQALYLLPLYFPYLFRLHVTSLSVLAIFYKQCFYIHPLPPPPPISLSTSLCLWLAYLLMRSCLIFYFELFYILFSIRHSTINWIE